MIAVLLSWVYILITAGSAGAAVLYPFYRFGGYAVRRLDSYLYAGLAAVTVYAQFFSLFSGVGLAANLLLLFGCLALNLGMRKRIGAMVAETVRWEKRARAGRRRWEAALPAALLLLFAYGASTGFLMYDSNLYHAQSIRWIEEYGVVRGLGNLHNRLAYNSASFALTALYSLRFLFGQSLHTVAGLMALAGFLDGLRLLDSVRRRRLRASDFARAGELYYVTIIFREMMSPASDYFTMLSIFWLVVRWLDLLERNEDRTAPYGLLCVFAVFTLTLKASAGLILLLTLQPAWMLLRNKRWKEIAAFLALGVVTALPFLIRNVLISGFLLYPYSELDLFAVDWRMPVFTAQYDRIEIQSWARGIDDLAYYDLPVTKWLPYWLRHELSGMERLWVLASFAALPLQAGTALWIWLRRKRAWYRFLPLLFTLTACWLFWQLSAPMMRYGYAFPLLLPLVTCGVAAGQLPEGRKEGRAVCCGVLLALLCYRGVHMAGDVAGILASHGVSVMQQDYDRFAAEPVKMGDFLVYVPVEGDQMGYDPFPSTPDAEYVAPRGKTLRDGFVFNYEKIRQ